MQPDRHTCVELQQGGMQCRIPEKQHHNMQDDSGNGVLHWLLVVQVMHDSAVQTVSQDNGAKAG